VPTAMTPASATVAPTGGTAPTAESVPHLAQPRVVRPTEECSAPAPVTASAPLPKSGASGVELALQLKKLRTEDKAGASNRCKAAGRDCTQINGFWCDDTFEAKVETIKVKALGKAYFRMLEKHPELKEVFKLGQKVIWVTPSGKALWITPDEGCETMSDKDIDALFATK